MRGEGGLLHAGIGLPSCQKSRRRKKTGEVCFTAFFRCAWGTSLNQNPNSSRQENAAALFTLLPWVGSLKPNCTGVAEIQSKSQAGYRVWSREGSASRALLAPAHVGTHWDTLSPIWPLLTVHEITTGWFWAPSLGLSQAPSLHLCHVSLVGSLSAMLPHWHAGHPSPYHLHWFPPSSLLWDWALGDKGKGNPFSQHGSTFITPTLIPLVQPSRWVYSQTFDLCQESFHF